MTAIFPVPSGRTSDLLLQQRLLAQVQFEQRELLRFQDQLSTGLRFTTPSEDAPAATRAVLLQRLLEQKDQLGTNLDTSQSYLAASDNALAGVSQTLIDIRGLALSASDSGAGDNQREAVAEEVRRAIQTLVQVGNRQFRGRYLFAGSQTNVEPFEQIEDFVLYKGNERHLGSFADVNLLIETNSHGSEVFGAVSAEVRSTADLNPVLTENTRLVDLRGGSGVADGSIQVSDGTNNVVVDLSSAETIGDVARLIRDNAPPGRTITARVTTSGISLVLDTEGGGSLLVTEVAEGTTAAELGILQPEVELGPLLGDDLNPRLTLTTPVRDLLGARASLIVESAGSDNDFILEARQRGDAGNGYTLALVDDDLLAASPGLVAGTETINLTTTDVPARAALPLTGANNNLLLTGTVAGTSLNNIAIEVVAAGPIGNAAQVTFDPVGRQLTLGIDTAGGTQIQTLIDEINAEGTFTAAYDASEPGDGGLVPTAIVPLNSVGVISGNTGNSGAVANTIQVHVDPGQTSGTNVVDAVNADPIVGALFEARLDPLDDFGVPGSGAVEINAGGVTSGGSGVEFDASSGIQILNGSNSRVIRFDDDETVEDLLNTLNGADIGLLAELNAERNAIDVRSRLSGGDLFIGENGGTTAAELGIRSLTRETLLADLNHGLGIETVIGDDFTIRRNDGVELSFDVAGLVSLGDVIDLVNGHVDNQDPSNSVVARLAAFGNGIEFLDDNAAGGPLTVLRANNSSAATGLGLIAKGTDETVGVSGGPALFTLTGADVNPLETEGVFNTLTRLQEAIENFDTVEIERSLNMLDVDFNRLNFVRSEVGARQRGLESLSERLSGENVELRSALSNEIDADIVETISSLSGRQASLEASLRLIGRTFQLSLLEFI